MKNFSKRNYAVQISEGGIVNTIKPISINDLLKEHKNGFEYIYSLQENIDDILDLKINECMFFKGNRDNDLSKGIITRID